MGEFLPAEERVEVIRSYAKAYPNLRTFIETGTADGSTTAALVDDFDRLYTIELDYGYYLQVIKRFAREPKVLPLQGDSSVVLKELLFELEGHPAIYWLDAHWPGPTRGKVDTPIEDEIRTIFYYEGPKVVLIDDARLFGEDPAYPSTNWVQKLIRNSVGSWHFEVKDDIMRVTPKG